MMEGQIIDSERDVPCFDSYDGCCEYVGQQGKRKICHLGEHDDVVKVNTHHLPACLQDHDQAGAHCDRKQV